MKRQNQIVIALSIVGIAQCIGALIMVYVLVTGFEKPLKGQEYKAKIETLIESIETGEKVLSASDQAYRIRGFLRAVEASDEIAGAVITAFKYICLAWFVIGAGVMLIAFDVRKRLVEKSGR